MSENPIKELDTYQSADNTEYSGTRELLIDEKYLNNYKNSIVIKILKYFKSADKVLDMVRGWEHLLKTGK